MSRSASSNGQLWQAFPHGGRIRSLVVGEAWAEFDPAGVDLFEIDVPVSTGRVIYTNTATHPSLDDGDAVTADHLAASRTRFAGTYTACFDRDDRDPARNASPDAAPTVRFFFALVDADPGETAILAFEEAAS